MKKGSRLCTIEKHWSFSEIAEALGLDVRTAKKIFGSAPGTVNVGTPNRKVIRVPDSVFQRVRQERREPHV